MKKWYKDTSEKTVKEKTFKTGDQWKLILNRFNVKKHGHTLSAKYLKEKYKVNPWWAQVLTIKYEYEKNLRK